MIWKILVVATATLIAFRRSGLLRHPAVRALLWPGPSAPNRAAAPPPAPERSKFGDRVFLVLLVTAATAVAALIVTRMLIASAGPAAR
jgi:hypothetical protein